MSGIEIVSTDFLVYVFVAFWLYHFLPQQYKKLFLLLASYLFYISWGLEYFAVLIVFTTVNYYFARLLEKNPTAVLLTAAISINAITFLVLKALVGPYGENFFTVYLGAERAEELTALLLPVGFSFYILEGIAYLVDVYRRQLPAERNYLSLALYFAYFPKMLAGPIERSRSFLAESKKDIFLESHQVEEAGYLILLGLLRKVVVSDRLRLFLPVEIFSSPVIFSPVERIVWLLVFAFVLYNDFAGYSSIMRGVSMLFGIKLKINFMQPMFARTFSDFWTRWHISLSEWLRDYVFFPVRRYLSRKHAPLLVMLVLPPLLTMLVSGYWHGAYLSIIVWGLLHGFYLVIEQILQRKKILNSQGKYQWLNAVLVFFGTTFAWIFFLSLGMGPAKAFLSPMSTATGIHIELVVFLELLVLMSISLWCDLSEQKEADLAFPRLWSPNKQGWFVAFVCISLLLSLSVGNDISGFVYQGF